MLGSGALQLGTRGLRQQLLLDPQHLPRPVRRSDPGPTPGPLPAHDSLLSMGADDSARPGQ